MSKENAAVKPVAKTVKHARAGRITCSWVASVFNVTYYKGDSKKLLAQNHAELL